MGGGGQSSELSIEDAKARAKAKAEGPAMWMSSDGEGPILGKQGQMLWRIHGIDYDLASFVADHPGGELAIRLGQGIDCTDLYESYHSSHVAFRALDKHRVTPGAMADLGKSTFKHDLDEVVRLHFAGKGRFAYKGTTKHHVTCATVFACEVACFVGAFWYGSMLASFLLPWFFWVVAVNVSHDASHFCFSTIPWVNEIVAFAAVPFLYEPITWAHQHVVSHHTHCNEVEADVDLQHFVPLRIHTQDTKPHVMGNPTPFDYLKVMLVGLHLGFWVPLNASGLLPTNLQHEYKRSFSPDIHMPIGLAGHKKYRMRGLVGPMLTLSVVVFAFSMHGWYGGLLLLPPFVIDSLLFIMVTQASHIQPEVQVAELSDEPDFFKYQAKTSVDYSTPSDLWRLLTGGLNTQALHHCLPYVSCCHYTDLYPAFEACCNRHGIQLHKRAHLLHATSTCMQHVWGLNQNRSARTWDTSAWGAAVDPGAAPIKSQYRMIAEGIWASFRDPRPLACHEGEPPEGPSHHMAQKLKSN